MPTLPAPPPSTTGARSSDDRTRRRWRRSLLTLTALVVALVAAAALLIGRGGDHTYTNVLVARARPGVSSADLLALEGRIVGSDAVADPATGRLPDVAAFQRVGVSAMRIDHGTLSVEFLLEATSVQRAAVRTLLSRSPLIATVEEVRRSDAMIEEGAVVERISYAYLAGRALRVETTEGRQPKDKSA
jgi:hypothetical protein